MKTEKEITESLLKFCKTYDFYNNGVSVESYRVEGKKNSVKITITQMYEKPIPSKFERGLLGYFNAIQELVGADNLDILNEISNGGCETCDYGSQYGWEFIAWDN